MSVIIPAYNAMRYLPQTLETVLSQTLSDFEVLVVNDGSRDEIVAWMTSITDPRVVLINQHNQGTATARNSGIARARGEYIAFLDADDLWKPEKLARQVTCLDANPEVGLVDAWVCLAGPDGNPTSRILRPTTSGSVLDRLLLSNIIVCGSSPMVRRQCFERVGTFNPAYPSAEDWDMWLRIARHYPFATVPAVLLLYRQHPSNKSKDYSKMLQDSVAILEGALTDAPRELALKKQEALSAIHLYIAWKAVAAGNWADALSLRDRASMLYPAQKDSKDYKRLSAAIALMRVFGKQLYETLRSVNWTARRILQPSL